MLGVSFVPSETGSAVGTLELHSGRGTASVALSGVAEAKSGPAIELEPASIRFGQVQVGGSATASVSVANHGDDDLHVSVAGVGEPFETAFEEAVVAPGSRTDVVLRFAPENAGRSEGRLVIRSNDPKVKEALIPLKGTGVDAPVRSAIAVSVESLDFGAVAVGQEQRAFIEIRNDGHDPLALSSITLREPFHASRRGRWIEPGRTLSLPVVFSPSEVGERSDFMLISSNDPETGLLSIPLRGRGLEEGSAGDSLVENASSAGGERVGGGAAGAGAEAPLNGLAAVEASPDGTAGADAPNEGNAAAEEFEPGQDLAGPRVLEGSEVEIASYLSQVGDTHIGDFSVDRGAGTVSLEGLQLPMIDAGMKQTFTFSPTDGFGTVDSDGEIEIGLPVQVMDRWGNPAAVDVVLTTGTASVLVDNRLISMMGDPVGMDGAAKLVGLAVFGPGGPAPREVVKIILKVQVD